MLGMGKEFTRGDKIIYTVTYTWIFAWILVFVIGTIYNLLNNVSDEVWMTYWKVYFYLFPIASCGVCVWFLVGGLVDIKAMFKRLSTMDRDESDAGMVVSNNDD